MQNFSGLRPGPPWGAYSAPKPPAVRNSLRALRALHSSRSLCSPLGLAQNLMARASQTLKPPLALDHTKKSSILNMKIFNRNVGILDKMRGLPASYSLPFLRYES